jgi:hypothetical protein
VRHGLPNEYVPSRRSATLPPRSSPWNTASGPNASVTWP